MKSSGIIKIVIAIVVVAVGVTAGVKIVQNVTNSPKSTIEKFEKAYNQLDIDGMIECFDPKVQAIYSGANSLLGDIFGMDISDMSSLIPFISMFADEDELADMPEISIDIKDVDKTSKTTAIVYCDVEFSGDFAEEELIFDMVKIDGEWYISSDGIMDELFL